MVNITSTYEYVVVYNTDSSLITDQTYRFSCFVSFYCFVVALNLMNIE